MHGRDADDDERRVAPRYDAHTLATPVVCRVNPGHEVQLANVSAVGARVESTFPLLPGRPLQLHVQSRGRRIVIETRVAWCAVTGVTPSRGVRYAAGLAFARWIDLVEQGSRYPEVRGVELAEGRTK